ncbi:MAG: hypothetical protein U0942_08465 [Parvibaculum sp.]|uniref:hypothetical protein n=1 Tax=Parvibaculum sp. TaxID=2024848 RepID=UPI002AB8C4B9|nr:hypothetical protein [Parvibaculum sp.]MDZ4381358.1 hypothetical protein [Parvibaculum sp.]
MQYLPTAFANIEFAWKLLVYGEAGEIDLDKLDVEIVFQDHNGRPFFVPPARIFSAPEDLILALQNNLTIAFGAAAITLHRSIEEAGHRVPRGAFVSEDEQCIALVYQVRNAFAHDIAEPKWEIRNPVFAREYVIAGKTFDLQKLDGREFRYEDFSVESLFLLKTYAERNLFG